MNSPTFARLGRLGTLLGCLGLLASGWTARGLWGHERATSSEDVVYRYYHPDDKELAERQAGREEAERVERENHPERYQGLFRKD